MLSDALLINYHDQEINSNGYETQSAQVSINQFNSIMQLLNYYQTRKQEISWAPAIDDASTDAPVTVAQEDALEEGSAQEPVTEQEETSTPMVPLLMMQSDGLEEDGSGNGVGEWATATMTAPSIDADASSSWDSADSDWSTKVQPETEMTMTTTTPIDWLVDGLLQY